MAIKTRHLNAATTIGEALAHAGVAPQQVKTTAAYLGDKKFISVENSDQYARQIIATYEEHIQPE